MKVARARLSWRGLLASCAALWLAACAAPLPPNTISATPAAMPSAAASAVSAPARFALEVNADSELRSLLLTHLDLARYQHSSDEQGLSTLELDRLAAAAPAQARALLETEGYFNAAVTLSREGRPSAEDSSEALAPLSPRNAESIKIKVEPGPRSQITKIGFEWTGAVSSAAGADQATAAALQQRLTSNWPLREGDAFTQAAWSAAKSDALTLAHAQGYPLAHWEQTAARVDADANQVELALRLDSGPLFHLGEVKIEGLQAQSASTITRLAGFKPGQAYSEKALLDYQERLQKTLLFDSVSVEMQTEGTAPEAAPVWVRVKEGPLQDATTGIGYHANTGQRVTLEHIHRQPFGLPMRSQLKLDLGRELRSAQLDLSSYPQEDMQRNLASLKIEKDLSSEPITTSLTGRIGRLRETAEMERLYFLELLRSREERSGESIVTAGAASLNTQWTLRKVDSVLLPTQGYTALLLLGAGRADSSAAQNGLFGRAQLKLASYHTLARHWYVSARSEVSQVLASNRVGIPDALLFRAGGDDSVRGYAYRSLSPIVDGDNVGGRVLWTGSLELARPLNLAMPNLWAATFVDAGQAAGSWRALQPSLGYGVGLRWRSPVGPLKLDVARGVDVHRWRLHFSVGIAL
jgi:translocation and assembly module TamA